MRLGGKLSGAIERLARQVRKRQEFKKRAVAAVSMERGSIWAILIIMTLLFVVIHFMEPTITTGLFTSIIGQMTFPWCVFTILVGILWSRKITKVIA
jgi:Flp pilus assembly protein TadB